MMLDGFIADEQHSLDRLLSREQDSGELLSCGAFSAGVGALVMGSSTHLAGQFADAGLPDEVIVYVAPVTPGAGAPLLPRRLELRLEELGRSGAFAVARYAVVRGGER